MESNSFSEIQDEADRIEEDCLYSAKAHFECARIWGRWNLGLGIPAVLLSAIAGISILKDYPAVGGACAVLSGSITGLLTFLKPSERASNHHKAGTLYNSLKNRSRVFRKVETLGESRVASLQKRLKQLSEDRNSLNESSPEILRPAFNRARKAIEGGEANYRADAQKVRNS